MGAEFAQNLGSGTELGLGGLPPCTGFLMQLRGQKNVLGDEVVQKMDLKNIREWRVEEAQESD